MKKIIALTLSLMTLVLSETTIFAAVTTDNIKYAASTSITITMNSLGSSATACRQSTVVDNSANLYVDAYVTTISSMSNTALTAPSTVQWYIFGSEDGTNFDSDDAALGASDAAYTINSPSNGKIASIVSAPTAGKAYVRTFSVAQLFGGVLPRKWVLVGCNVTGQSLAASGNSASYSGITYTNQ